MGTWNNPKVDWTPADGVTDSDFNKIGSNLNYLKGVVDTDITELQSLKIGIDQRTWEATTWDLDDNPTHIDIKSGATVLATIDLTWTDLKLTEAIIVCNGKTITYTITWNDTKFVSKTKVVS
jgi:hypothetical protein